MTSTRAILKVAPVAGLFALLLAGPPLIGATAPAAAGTAFELVPRQRLTFGGQVVAKDDAKAAGVDFGVIPTSPVRLKPYYNVFTGMTENRPVPGNPHPIPVLRAAHVRVFAERPDPAKLALDQVAGYANEAQLDGSTKFAVVSDADARNVRLISFAAMTLPQDRWNEWQLSGTAEPLTLADHIADPVADIGRAVLSKTPLPVTGTMIYGTRKQNWGPAELWKVRLPDGRPTKIADAVEPRVALNGSYVDRVDMRNLEIRNAAGKLVGKISLEPNEAGEFAISLDGRRVAVSTEKFVEVPDALPKRETTTLVYSFKGKIMGEVKGYDDPTFMPDGRLLVTGRYADAGLFIADYERNTIEPIRFKGGPSTGEPAPEWPRTPAVSPDGKWVAYVSGRKAYVVGIDGRGCVPIWDAGADPEPQTGPAFSPDSSLVAVNIIPITVMTGPGKVAVFDLRNHVRQQLETTQGADSEIPLIWQPDKE